jgi:hypothetical protein
MVINREGPSKGMALVEATPREQQLSEARYVISD